MLDIRCWVLGWKDLNAEYITKNWCIVLVHKAFSSPPMAYKGTSSGWKNDLGAENTHQEIGKASSGG